MNNLEQNSLANKMLKILREWLNAIIPEQTKDCIRSKSAIIVEKNSDSTFNVVLSEDLGDFLDLKKQKDSGKITEAQYKQAVSKITIDNLFGIKNETYSINDYVIVGYLDNKLTNAFILCKNRIK